MNLAPILWHLFCLFYLFRMYEPGTYSLFCGTYSAYSTYSECMNLAPIPAHQDCSDTLLATFLNEFINDRRGKRDGPQPEPETELTNNIIFRKMKIALNLNAEDMLEILALAGMQVSKHELSALFRRPGHKHYRDCKDQMVRCFFSGLQTKFRNAPR